MTTIERIINRSNKHRGKDELPQMRQHQDWVKMHCDTSLTNPMSKPMTDFLNMVQRLIPEDKYHVFEALLRSPLPTTALTSVIFDRLSRVFEGRDPMYNYQFEKTDYADDWEWYRQERLHEPSVWRNKAWDYYRTEPNSIVVIDLPAEGRTDKEDKYPQPYFYWVTLDRIIDFETDDDGALLWVLFKDEDRKKVYLIDDKFYRVYDYTDKGYVITEDFLGKPTVMNEHPLGYCPATFFIHEPVSLSTPNVKKSPVSAVLSELDWYLFFATSKKQLDTYGSYPIYSGYEPDCSFQRELKDGERTIFQHCKHGILVDDNGNACMNGDGTPIKCPVCSEHRIAGAGSYITVPVPGEGEHDLRNPVQILSVDKDSLDFNTQEMERKKNIIISTCVGVDRDGINEFGASEKQIDAAFESQTTILIRIKKSLEGIQTFVDKTCCLLRYGKAFVSLDISYGNEFYASTTAQIRERYAKAKEAGAPEADLMALRKQVIETEYRNNSLQGQRMVILSELEPLAGLTRQEAIEAMEKGLANPTDVKIKINFEALIRRFERENGNLINFGVEESDFYKRIENIKQQLTAYVTEN